MFFADDIQLFSHLYLTVSHIFLFCVCVCVCSCSVPRHQQPFKPNWHHRQPLCQYGEDLQKLYRGAGEPGDHVHGGAPGPVLPQGKRHCWVFWLPAVLVGVSLAEKPRAVGARGDWADVWSRYAHTPVEACMQSAVIKQWHRGYSSVDRALKLFTWKFYFDTVCEVFLYPPVVT